MECNCGVKNTLKIEITNYDNILRNTDRRVVRTKLKLNIKISFVRESLIHKEETIYFNKFNNIQTNKSKTFFDFFELLPNKYLIKKKFLDNLTAMTIFNLI